VAAIPVGGQKSRSFSQSNSPSLLRCNVKANLAFHYASRLLVFALIGRDFAHIRRPPKPLILSLTTTQLLSAASSGLVHLPPYNLSLSFPFLCSLSYITNQKYPTTKPQRMASLILSGSSTPTAEVTEDTTTFVSEQQRMMELTGTSANPQA
jgi:hypothetical protein